MGAAEWSHSFSIRVPAAVHADMLRVCRITGASVAEFVARAIEEAIDAGMADDDVRAALAAMRRLDARQAAQHNSYPGSLPESDDGSADHSPRSGTGSAVDADPSPQAGSPGRRISDASPQGPRKSGETPARSAAPVPAAERPTPSASRSAAPVQPETRAPAQDGELNDEQYRSLGTRLRAAREARGISQAAVAAAVDCSDPTVSLVERGMQRPSSALAARIEAWIAKAPTPKHPNTKIAMRSKAKVTPSSDGRAPNASQSAPRALPKGMELYSCRPLNARITERQCASNKARAKGDIRLEEHCPGCPGVKALAESGSG